jgi:hypothetical protein
MKISESRIEDRGIDEKRSIRHDKSEESFRTESFISKQPPRHYEREG